VATAAVRVEGLGRLIRDFRRLDRGLAREVQQELRSIAGFVADDARLAADAQGLRDTGKLISRIKPFYRGSTAGVRSGVMRRGYPYGGVYEYGLGRTRAYLEPTLQRDERQIVEAFEDLLDRMTSSAGFGRGGRL
jgi:hypothetical protein